ncbi:hypothetical protein IV38_GL000466 [Lactobacillus selangorensis]|uniref:Uncharacterized protein n=1 Tax=Lactobacillus selangorensis TaxID=81857 RepID=A0A0R2FZG1_9LACO|nr:hypothetical protein [Lactobacillus selangorensis]KRN29580.1 hypothetical protein IV38_GL000466 [Lactobacillus selangorensis]KRN33890.1 hypothetical protein IV40_GL000202 [Lactobacillus selangorensis]
MIFLLILMIIVLLIIDGLQRRRIKTLRACVPVNEQQLITDATALLTTMDASTAIKQLRMDNPALDLVQAQRIVKKAQQA